MVGWLIGYSVWRVPWRVMCNMCGQYPIVSQQHHLTSVILGMACGTLPLMASNVCSISIIPKFLLKVLILCLEMCSDRHNVWWCDGDAVVYIYDSNRNTVSPSLAVRPRLSQDQQRRGLSVVSTLEVNLEHGSSPSAFLSLSCELMLTSLSPRPSDEVPGRHDPQCCLFSCWWDAGWLSAAVQRFLRLRIFFASYCIWL